MSNTTNRPKKRFVYDAILVLALLVVGLFALLAVRLAAAQGGVVIVKHNREVICEISLREAGEYTLLDGKCVLIVSGGEAYMHYADCPDKLCIKQGRVSKSGESIICLPNKLSIVVE